MVGKSKSGADTAQNLSLKVTAKHMPSPKTHAKAWLPSSYIPVPLAYGSCSLCLTLPFQSSSLGGATGMKLC